MSWKDVRRHLTSVSNLIYTVGPRASKESGYLHGHLGTCKGETGVSDHALNSRRSGSERKLLNKWLNELLFHALVEWRRQCKMAALRVISEEPI